MFVIMILFLAISIGFCDLDPSTSSHQSQALLLYFLESHDKQ